MSEVGMFQQFTPLNPGLISLNYCVPEAVPPPMTKEEKKLYLRDDSRMSRISVTTALHRKKG
jgi:hypothetical protein